MKTIAGIRIYESKSQALNFASRYAATLKSNDYHEDFFISDGNSAELLDEFGKIEGNYHFIAIIGGRGDFENPDETYREFYYE